MHSLRHKMAGGEIGNGLFSALFHLFLFYRYFVVGNSIGEIMRVDIRTGKVWYEVQLITW